MIYHDTTAIDAVNAGNDVPDAFYRGSTLIATSKWHSTDAWRGYHEVVPEPGFKKLEQDWLTGDWGDAISDEHNGDKFDARLHALEPEHKDLYVIYTPSSNVFSTITTVLARDPDTPVNKGKLVATKTRLFEEDDGSFRLRYHATYVVSYDAKRKVFTLNTGGWHTMTTAKRMNDYLPSGWRVNRRDWKLRLNRPGEDEITLSDSAMEFAA